MKPKRTRPICKCGTVIGNWFCARLNRYVCSPCLDREIISLQAKAAKAWEAEIGLWQDPRTRLWHWVADHDSNRYTIEISVKPGYQTRESALAAARRTLKRMRLIERKVKSDA